MRLTLQDKLALALTSYGSVRALSRDLGVSARTVGRWLRAGEVIEDESRDDVGEYVGVKEIPEYAAPLIDTVFEIHSDIAREQARVDKLPFNKAAPLFVERKQLRDGRKGDRAVAEHAQFVRPDLRVESIKHAAKSGVYLQASVRSRIDLKRYFKERAIEKIKERGWRMSSAELARSMLKSFLDKEAREKNRIIDKGEPFALYTQYENISPQRRDHLQAALGIEDKLRKKHEPATGTSNTALAEAYLFQLMPRPSNANDKPQVSNAGKPRRQSAASRRHIKGAGPK